MITNHNTHIILRSLSACRSINYLRNKMKFIAAILVVCTLEWASSASTSSTLGCTACKNTVDWMKMNGNALSTIKSDERFNVQFIELLESDESAEVCINLNKTFSPVYMGRLTNYYYLFIYRVFVVAYRCVKQLMIL